jgi:hypothetical protein
VNIAPDDAKNGTEYLCRDRDPRLYEASEVEAEWTKQHCGTFAVVDNTLWQSCMEIPVLKNRAWAIQVQLLSPTILYFGRAPLFQTGQACEWF